MTNLTTLLPGASYGDLLTTTNNGQGLSLVLEPLQDGLGNNSIVTISKTAINFNRSGPNTFQLDGVALTATATALNNVGNAYSPGNPTTLYEDDGLSNIFIGNTAGRTATAGSVNCALGIETLTSITTGSFNCAFGVLNLSDLTFGNSNTSIGSNVFESLTTGSNNVGVGSSIANGFFHLNSCTFIGSGSTASLDSLTNAIAIGANAIVNSDNSIVLGGIVAGHGCYVGIGTSSPIYTLDITNVDNGISNECTLYMAKTSTVPGTPAGGGVLFVSGAGALTYISPGGTTTIIGPA